MYLVDADGLPALVDACPMLAMRRILPDLIEFVGRDGCGLGAQFAAAGERIGLQRQQHAILPADLELIGDAGRHIGREDLPYAGIRPVAHDVPAAIPVVEIADDRNALSIRRPDREMKALDPFMLQRMCAHLVEQAQMRALAGKVVVHRTEDRAETIGSVTAHSASARRAR